MNKAKERDTLRTSRQLKILQRKQREIIISAISQSRALTGLEAAEYTALSKEINALHTRLDTAIREAAAKLPEYITPRECAPARQWEIERAKIAAARLERRRRTRRAAVVSFILAALLLAAGVITWAYIERYRQHTRTMPEIIIHTAEPQRAGGAGNEIIY